MMITKSMFYFLLPVSVRLGVDTLFGFGCARKRVFGSPQSVRSCLCFME